MLTSLDCLHHQVYDPLENFATDTITLADILGRNGYTTVAFTGGAYLSSTYGFAKGFDAYQEIKLYGNKAIRFDEAERLAELSCDWINTNHDKGFFLFLHTYQPHDPYANFSPQGKMFLSEDAKWDQIRMETLFGEGERYETSFSDEEKKNIIGLYEGEIRYTDEVLIKPIISALKDQNIYDSTILIITSDHGEEFYEHEAWLHDHNLYEEGIKIPLIIKFPNSEYEGDKIKSIIRITDIMPTILEQLDINTNQFQFDGRSLFPILRGKEKSNRTFLSDLALRQFQTPPTIITTNSNNLKLIINKEVVSPFIKRKSQEFNDLRIELYDLENDPMETTNLASQAKYRSLCLQLTREILNKYENARIERDEKDKVVMDSSLEERLKALGYIR
jgi:arylsulfatase A-like enzyme